MYIEFDVHMRPIHVQTDDITENSYSAAALSRKGPTKGTYLQLMRHTDETYSCENRLYHREFVKCSCAFYDSFQWNCYTPEINQIHKLRFLSISWYKFKPRFWFNLNLYQGIRVSGFGGFRGCSIFSGNCRTKRPTKGTYSHWMRHTDETNSCENRLHHREFVQCCCAFYKMTYKKDVFTLDATTHETYSCENRLHHREFLLCCRNGHQETYKRDLFTLNVTYTRRIHVKQII